MQDGREERRGRWRHQLAFDAFASAIQLVLVHASAQGEIASNETPPRTCRSSSPCGDDRVSASTRPTPPRPPSSPRCYFVWQVCVSAESLRHSATSIPPWREWTPTSALRSAGVAGSGNARSAPSPFCCKGGMRVGEWNQSECGFITKGPSLGFVFDCVCIHEATRLLRIHSCRRTYKSNSVWNKGISDRADYAISLSSCTNHLGNAASIRAEPDLN